MTRCFYRRGFTLVEVMIVVAIIAVLAVIAVPQFLRAKVSANYSAARATLKVIGSALETYAGDNQTYPTNTADLISTLPAYLQKDYFNGTHSGYQYTATLSDYDYTIVASPAAPANGATVFTLATGGTISESTP